MNEKIEDFIKSLPRDKINEINSKEVENTITQHTAFRTRFSKGECYICDSKLNDFDESKPCIHWLLRPPGFSKRHLILLLQKFNYSNIDSYLRWVANEEAPFKNINDFSEEKKETKIFEYIIKYKNLEWSFSCSNNDYLGHKDAKEGTVPHYHFQMRVDNKPFINFHDFHIKLSEYDQFVIKVKRNEIEGLHHSDGFGSSLESLSKEFSPEEILRHSKTTDNINNATIHTSYIIRADPGKTISGNDLADLMEESKKNKTPLWNLLPKLKNAKTSAIVGPGEGVPEIFHRKGRDNNK